MAASTTPAMEGYGEADVEAADELEEVLVLLGEVPGLLGDALAPQVIG